jgi:hypothetical protein
MTRPTSRQARIEADTYATRAILIELLRMMNDANPGALNVIKGATERVILRPDDMSIADPDIREAVDLILKAAAN